MAAASQPTQPEGRPTLDRFRDARGSLASPATHPPSLAQPALRRHTPEVGAVCGKAARTDLCGGRGVISVPTATAAKSGAAQSTRQHRSRVSLTLNPGYSSSDGYLDAPR